MGLHQTKSTAKDITNSAKRHPTELKTVFASDIPNNGLVSKIRNELMQLSRKAQPNETLGRGPTATLPPRRTDGQQAHAKARNFTNHHRKASQTLWRHHCIPAGTAIERTRNNKRS